MDRRSIQGLLLALLLLIPLAGLHPAGAYHLPSAGRTVTWTETELYQGEPAGASRTFEMSVSYGRAMDEWGRHVEGLAFTFPTLRTVWNEHDEPIGTQEIPVTLYFESANGRYLGSYDSARESRAFPTTDPTSTSPWRYAALMIGVNMRGTEPGEAFPLRTGTAHLEPDPGAPASQCTWYRVVESMQPSSIRVCVDGSDLPLVIEQVYGDRGVRYERQSASPVLPPPTGAGLEPAQLPRQPWGTALTPPGLPPVAVPPSEGQDWAASLSARVTAAATSLNYAPYALGKEGLYATSQFAGFPGFGYGTPLAGLSTQDVVSLGNGESSFHTVTSTLRTGLTEVIVGGGNGFVRDNDPLLPLLVEEHNWPTEGLAGLPATQVPAGVMADRYDGTIPWRPQLVMWDTRPYWTSQPDSPLAMMWTVIDSCFDGADDSRFAVLSAVNGQLVATGRVETRQSGSSAGCSWGISFPMSAGEAPILVEANVSPDGITYTLPAVATRVAPS